jgi:NitT/TauT family transport system ATP-binding protein
LSGGMRKRVAMAQNWIIDRGTLFMDEPFTALDVHTRLRMETELLTLWEGRSAERLELEPGGRAHPATAERKTVVFVTHDLEEAIALADRVVVMSAGPAATIIGDFPVTLSRPRDTAEIRLDPEFHHIHKEIWSRLRMEVQKAYSDLEHV